MLRKILFLVLIFGGFCLLVNGGKICNAAKEAAADQINVMPLNPKIAGGSHFVGDINGDGVMDPADMVYFIRYFYRGGPPPPNMEDADLNEDGDVNVGDLIVLSKWLWFYTW
jgi:hypothetical protein